ncbi:LysR substrate-binding domain-containing protein [Streptomyces sp. LN499]|uniref:LysR substrate-binding domain-containing protein n=1 Tax=Streptomyces sp. LN499 TaxID=3112977 RepID=UPI00371AAB1C
MQARGAWIAESDPALRGPPLLLLGVAVIDADPPVAVLIIGGRSSSEGQGEPAADMDARELAPQLLFFIEAGVQEGSHRFPSPSPDSYGSVRFPGLGVVVRVNVQVVVALGESHGYVRLPIDEAGLRVTPLYTEPRVAVLPAGHRFAGKQEVTEADLAGETLVWHGVPSTQPTKRQLPNAGYPVRGVDETLEHVAAGRGTSFLARSASVFYSHPDVVYVPIPDLAPDQVCLAVAASHTSPVVDDFVTAAQSTAEVTAECGNYEMWQLGGDAASRHA